MRTFKKIVFLSILLFSFPAFAADVTLQWDANPPEDQVVGYKLYYNEWSQLVGNVTEYTLTNLTPGDTYSIHATAYNNYEESGPSNTVTYDAPPFVITDNPKESIVIEFTGSITLK
jgi:hypothetical protein